MTVSSIFRNILKLRKAFWYLRTVQSIFRLREVSQFIRGVTIQACHLSFSNGQSWLKIGY